MKGQDFKSKSRKNIKDKKNDEVINIRIKRNRLTSNNTTDVISETDF